MAANRANIGWYLDNQIGGEDDRFTGKVYNKEIDISAAEILDLFDTPKELVAAPGIGRVLEFLSIVIFLDYGTEIYATYGNLTVNYHDANTAVSNQLDEGTYLFNNADIYGVAQVLDAEVTLVANDALELRCGTGDPTAGGGGTLKVRIAYRIHDFN